MNDMTRTGLDTGTTAKISATGVQVHYGTNHALKDVSVEILDRTVTAFIGPSGCGKSTFLRCLNRMNDTVASAKVTGTILLDGEDIYD
nr:ATP-binding cassette domain-containing protein [Tabrizicola sp.]